MSAPPSPRHAHHASSTNTRLTNGFYHHPGPAGVNGSSSYTAPTPVKQNGFIRVPTKWRKENEEEGGATGIRSAINNNNHQLNLQGKNRHFFYWKGKGLRIPLVFVTFAAIQPPVTSCLQKCIQNGVKWNKTGSEWRFWFYCFKRNKIYANGTGPASKPSGISYRLSRPSLIKQPRPLRVTTANGSGQEVNRGPTARRNSVETPSTTENSPESPPEAPERGLSAEMVAQREVSILGETLEDMSLSSNSSLDRNDTSQEYMDDFDNLGNGGMGILLLSSKNDEDDSGLDQSCARFNEEDKMAVSGVSKAGLCFLDDGVDWRSNQQEDHEQGGSSLDLSPSDSCGSGGTYLWDEEGLEPMGGGNVSIHSNSNNLHIGSFDSDLNSIDVLENLESCDLDDDDLMLDEDLPEDDSLRSDGEGLAHMAQWRMRQLCWGNDNESDLESYKLTEDPGNKRTDGDLILDFSSSR
ncbi:hypothetical protein KUCAC02_036909 [Chaenocephalus aceratus]|nr:hypothetical protein KUCAC02_036909 [Chaenocephalus aceratus]